MMESEAKDKWCPMVRLKSDYLHDPVHNRVVTGSAPNTNCIASRCMMWRFLAYGTHSKGSGYCGLAGKET